MLTARTIFVTGTDTNVGKTVVTALLLAHAQSARINVSALKPFSSGGTADETLLGSLQDSSVRINFFNYPEPIAPWSAAKLHGSPVQLGEVLSLIRAHQTKCELLLIEGAGGLLVPLGENFTAADLIRELKAEVIVVAANRLGVLNHTLLTVEALRRRDVGSIRVALVDSVEGDVSRKSNLQDLRELLPGIQVTPIPFISKFRAEPEFIRERGTRLRAQLTTLLGGEAGKKNPPDTEAEGTFP